MFQNQNNQLTRIYCFVTLNLVNKFAAQLKSSQGFGILGLIVIGLLLLAIPLGIYLTRTQQLNKSKAFQPAPLSAPDLSITLVSDKGLYAPGDNVRVSVYVRNEIEAANIYVVKLKFPTDLLNFVSLDKTPSDAFVQTWTQDLVDNTAGTVNLVTELKDLAGGQNSGYRTPANQQYGSKLADLNFTAKTTGLKPITFDETSNEPSAIYSAITNANLITSKGPVNIEITTQPSATPAPTPTPITIPTPSGSNTPEFCMDVLTPAKNTTTDECQVFPNSCIPEGWVRDRSCETRPPTSQMCRSVLTPGYNPTTGECFVFSNSCLPTGWIRQSCPVSPSPTATPSTTMAPVNPNSTLTIAQRSDINRDGKLNIQDLSILKTEYQSNILGAKGDINLDQIVNSFDRALLLCELGKNKSIIYACSN